MSLPHQTSPPFPRLFEQPESRPRLGWAGWSRFPLGWRLFGLVLLCLIPRAWEAYLVRSVCHDGYYYLSVAAACRDGNWANAFSYLDLNIYPLILLGMRSLGLDWLVAGKLWSVLIASLAVLPLFGWVRRLFSDQVAWAACFLYSLHAEFVEFSLEPVRDPTFWFLFNLCLYATVRAISEGRFRWFFAGGVSLALAIHTRSEGWLLVIPFAMWVGRQWVLQLGSRRRLAAGSVLWLAVTPFLVLLVNVTILHDQPEWRLGRLNHFVMGYHWLAKQVNPNASFSGIAAGFDSSSALEQNPPPVPPPPVETKPVSVKHYFKQMASALEQINLGLLAFGLFWLRRDLGNWDHLALFLMSIAIAASVWILYDHTGQLNGRYFFTIYFALMPYFATGLLLVWNALWVGACRLEWTWLKPEYTALFLAVFAIGLGWADALTTSHRSREHEVELGDWLAERHGPFRHVVTDLAATRAGFHAYASVPSRLHNWGSMEWQFQGQPYDLLVLSRETTPPESRPLIEAAAKRLGLAPVALPDDFRSSDGFLVFVRSEAKPVVPTAPEEKLRVPKPGIHLATEEKPKPAKPTPVPPPENAEQASPVGFLPPKLEVADTVKFGD